MNQPVLPEPATPAECGRRNYSMVLKALAPDGTQQRIAKVLDVSESTVTRAKEELERGCLVLAHAGLKVVKAEKVCVNPGELAFLRGIYDRVKSRAAWILDEDEE